MRLRISPLHLVLPALIALTACGPKSDEVGGQPRTSAPIIEYVSLSPSTTEMLFTVGFTQQVVLGRSSACNYPPGIDKIPVVVNNTVPDFEKIAKIQPQRIILEKDLYSESTIEKLKELGIDVMVVDTNTPEKYYETLATIAKDAGRETMTSSYLDKVYGAESVFKASMPQGAKICVIAGDGTTGYMVLGKDTLLGNYIKEAGGEPVGPESVRFETVSAETLISYNPDLIITPKGVGRLLLADPQLKPVTAIAKGLVLDVDEDILLREGGRVDQLLESLGTGIGRIEIIKGN